MNGTTTEGPSKARIALALVGLLAVLVVLARFGPDTTAQAAPDPGASVQWEAYVPGLRWDIDRASCSELREQFDVAVRTNDATLRRTGFEHGNDRLLAYITREQDLSGCRP